MKYSIFALLLFVFSMSTVAQNNSFVVDLYPQDFVGQDDIKPFITVYPAFSEKNEGKAILICPGGGYSHLAMQHEGYDFASWLAENGVTAIVLKYRMPKQDFQIPLSDAKKAMIIIRENAEKWNIEPNKVGVMGFSAGGHLASTLLTHFDPDSRPDFGVLFYPVITMEDRYTHQGSKNNLLGASPDKELVENFSNEKQVKPNTPSVLLFHSDDDKAVPVENSLLFYEALRKNNIPASIHVFPTGGHGWGFRSDFDYHELMKDILLNWIEKGN